MNMSKYQITDSDLVYAAEFKKQPFGHQSPGLQRILNVLRGGPVEGKYILIVLEPYKRWALGQLSANRGTPVKVVAGYKFTDLDDAEWTVFKLRWKEQTGKDLNL
jgi:hypothetical protein